MRKEKVIVSINKKDGEIKLETHGVKGKACLDMLEELLGEIVAISDKDLLLTTTTAVTCGSLTPSRRRLKSRRGKDE